MMHLIRGASKTQSSRQRIAVLLTLSFSAIIVYTCLSLVIFPSSNILLHGSVSMEESTTSITTLDQIIFGIASNDKSWLRRKDFVKLWWRPDQMRGCVFLENPPSSSTPQNDSTSLPPICISGDTSSFRYTFKRGLRSAIRVARVVSETVALNHSNVKWYVFGDDDTIFFPENLLKTLSKYDHNLWYYIGASSESYKQNKDFSYDMAFGGAGFAISYPLAMILAKHFDTCLERYPHIYGSDGRIHACIAELGIVLTHESGFHQMDVRGDMFGLLAAHPLRPLVTLHHLEITEPIFPNRTALSALDHLLQAYNIDPHRIFQQTVCYDRWFSWTISISWGYAIQVHGRHVFLPDAIRKPATYIPWKKGGENQLYNHDTAEHHPDPCRRPVVFYMDSASSGRNGIKSVYKIMTMENCTFDSTSPRKLEEIRVFSHKLELDIKQVHSNNENLAK
ncbi:hypothetical protein Leryth_027091 [Lithospermum erythrorhizon]|nr:hypothetical protein Leryth_027091 [Lithospermum erythrorhizon]